MIDLAEFLISMIRFLIQTDILMSLIMMYQYGRHDIIFVFTCHKCNGNEEHQVFTIALFKVATHRCDKNLI